MSARNAAVRPFLKHLGRDVVASPPGKLVTAPTVVALLGWCTDMNAMRSKPDCCQHHGGARAGAGHKLSEAPRDRG